MRYWEQFAPGRNFASEWPSLTHRDTFCAVDDLFAMHPDKSRPEVLLLPDLDTHSKYLANLKARLDNHGVET